MTKSITADQTVEVPQPSLAVVVVTVCCSCRDNARGREGCSADGPEVWRINTRFILNNRVVNGFQSCV